MYVKCWLGCAVVGLLAVTTGCRSSSDDPADTAATGFVSEPVDLDDLPETAAARSVVPVSDERAIINGGVTSEYLEDEPGGDWYQFRSIDQLWLLEASGEVVTLPPLPARNEMVVRVDSAVEVGDTIVADLIECEEERAEFFGCREHGRAFIGVHTYGDDSWEEHEYPANALEGLEWPEEVGHPGYRFRILGDSDSGIVFALHANDAVRFGEFQPETGDFHVWGDSPKEYENSRIPYYCLNSDGRVINRVGRGDGWSTALTFEVFGPEGLEEVGPETEIGDLLGEDPVVEGGISVRCLDDRGIEVVFAGERDEVRVGLVDPDTLSVSLNENFQPPFSSAEDAEYSVHESRIDGDLVLRVTNVGDSLEEEAGIYRYSGDGQLDRLEGLEPDHEPFVIGDTIGTVDTTTGEVNVEHG